MPNRNKMPLYISAGFLLIPLILSACLLGEKSSPSTNNPSFTPSSFYSNGGVFISFPLVCPRNLRVGPGPTWRSITVGQSTRYDLEELYGVQASKDIPSDRGNFADTFSINLTASAARERQLSQFANICTVDGTIAILALDAVHDSDLSLLLQDWIMRLGEPDIVNWAPSGIGWRYRILVWPKQGVAIEVDAGAIPFDPNAGLVQIVVLFPFMETIDWDQWPLSGLVQDAPRTPNEGYPTQENPFDFDTMRMTIIAPPPNQQLAITTEPFSTTTPTLVPILTATPE
jgi:hypothetical protein